jgi:hypothetical protein
VKPLGHQIKHVEEQLRTDRASEEALWREVYEFILPDKSQFSVNVSDGIQRQRDLLDSTATRALEMFSSFLFTTLNNPSTQWIEVSAVDAPPDLAKSASFRKALADTQRGVQDWMVSGQSGLYDALHEAYMDFGSIGNAAVHGFLVGSNYRAMAKHMADVVFDEDAFGMLSAAFVRYHWTNEQVAQKFGEAALLRKGEDTLDAESMHKRRMEPGRQCYVHAVFPASPVRYSLAAALPKSEIGAAYASVWVRQDDGEVVPGSITPSNTQEYAVGRWSRTKNRRLGRGPGVNALPDIRMVNRISAAIVRASEKLNDPPMAVKDGSLLSPLRLFSGGVTYYDGDQPPTALLPPGASRVDVGDALLQTRQEAIQQAFFTPLFMNPDSPVRSATEILQLTDERNRAVGPMLTRVQTELFVPIVARALDLADQVGALPDLPPELEDVRLRIQYRSPLTASQRQIEALGVSRLFEASAPWAQVDPGVMDPFDIDKIADVLHAGSGAPVEILRTAQQVKQLRAARAEAQQQAMAQQAAAEVGIPAAEVAAQAQRRGQ